MAKDEKIKAMLEDLEKGVEDFFESDHFKTYLDTMSKFHNYSLNNQMLIARQNPDATLVAGYNSWIKNFERHVKSGEKAISILAPIKKKYSAVEIDKETGEEKIIEREYIDYRAVSVFDVSQTDGKELPKLINNLEGTVENFDSLMKAITRISELPIYIRPIEGTMNGYCSFESNEIVIKEGMSKAQTLKTAIHELAHSMLHKDTLISRERKEVEAESVAYIVCKNLGLDTSDYSFGYVAGWSKAADKDTLKKSMSTISKTSSEILKYIDKTKEERKFEIDNMMWGAYAKEKLTEKLEKIDVDGKVEEAFFYGIDYKTNHADVTVLALCDSCVPEHEIYVDEMSLGPQGATMSIVPINTSKNILPMECEEMRRENIPWVSLTGGVGFSGNIYEAEKEIQKLIEKYPRDSEDFNRKQVTVHARVTYMYSGVDFTTTCILECGGGSNLIDRLSVPPTIKTFLKRHSQICEVVEKSRYENAISRHGTTHQKKYEDMIDTWAKEQRKKINNELEPTVSKPPEYMPSMIKQYSEWEFAR